ncbi:hypothetical protein NQZ68_031262 [Dissostichus eleginoides]|nr:hypothetical protein NQZ68_031262 [Dissostichus eleginoides]
MTANIIKVIDDKLSPLVETINNHSAELQSANRRLDEAENRIMAVENSATAQKPRIAELEKQIQDQVKSADFLAHEKVRRVGPPLSRGSTGSIAPLAKRTDNSWARAKASARSLTTVILTRPELQFVPLV